MFRELSSNDENENGNNNNHNNNSIESVGAMEDLDRPSKYRQALFVCTYIISMLSINSLPAVYNPMTDENILTAATATQVVGFESYGIAFGKLCFGASSDMFGPRRVMGICFIVMTFLLFLFSFGSNMYFIALLAFTLEAANSSIWPSHICIVRGWYSKANTAEGTRLLGISSRGGAMLANGLYGILLMLGMYWRSIIRYVTIPLCILGVVLSRFHRDTRSQADFIGEVASTEAWKKNAKIVLSAKDFWFTAISLGCCTVVKRMGVITPIFFYATSKSIISVGDSVAMGIIYQLGLLCGTTVGGHYYAKLKKDHKAKALLLRKLNFLSTGCGISLGFFSLIAQNNSSGFMLFLEATLAFLMAFGVSTSYYVIPALFSVVFGGEKRGGMVSAFLDCFGYLFTSTFLLLQKGIISSPLSWSGVWCLIAFFNFIVILLVQPLENILERLENSDDGSDNVVDEYYGKSEDQISLVNNYDAREEAANVNDVRLSETDGKSSFNL